MTKDNSAHKADVRHVVYEDETAPGALNVEEIKDTLSRVFGWTLVQRDHKHSGLKSADPRITHACDHECPHCWANLYGKHMTVETFEHVLDLAQENGLTEIQFTGGEPTLNKQLIKMAEMARNRGFQTILRTHGRHMTREFDKKTGKTWAQAVAENFDEIIVSIDGTAEANFKMRPVIVYNKRVAKQMGEERYAEYLTETAHKQFDETIEGYRALSRAVGARNDVSLKINTVAARANLDNLPTFATYLAKGVSNGEFRIDLWDIAQVFPSPENTPEEQAEYTISVQELFRTMMSVTMFSMNISKRVKPVTDGRCLIIDESGRVYVGGEENTELGTLDGTNAMHISAHIDGYMNQYLLTEQRTSSYLRYDATP